MDINDRAAGDVPLESAVVLAKQGRDAVRRWKAEHGTAMAEAGWRTLSWRVPLEIFDHFQSVIALARRVGALNGAYVDPVLPYEALEAILAEAQAGFLAQLPPDECEPDAPAEGTHASPPHRPARRPSPAGHPWDDEL